MPNAAEIEVLECPAPKTSYLLSSRTQKPAYTVGLSQRVKCVLNDLLVAYGDMLDVQYPILLYPVVCRKQCELL